ncbi:restriction endonuclease subunit M, partial [Streptomyces sp. SID10244]|nr:restriction endonuclease subunit M [Streptomyces sp. SID10244]
HLIREHVDHFFNRYEVPTGKIDISIIFFERALQLLKPGGRAAFISSSQWLQTDYGGNLRKLFANDRGLEEIIDFGSLPVFDDASTYPAIFVMSNEDRDELRYTRIHSRDQLNVSSIIASPRKAIDYSTLGASAWSFGEFNLNTHLATSEVQYREFSEVGHAYVGDLTGRDETFV